MAVTGIQFRVKEPIRQMRIRAICGSRCLLVCLSITLTTASAKPQAAKPNLADCGGLDGQSKIRVQTEEVVVPITVIDRRGELVLDLAQQDFHVFDNGVEQEITHWELGGEPLAVALVIETSSHNMMMAPTIRAIGSIFTENILAAGGEGAVIAYNADVRVRQGFTQDHDLIEKAIKEVEFGPSDMKLYDAMLSAVRLLGDQHSARRRVMLIIGESQDSTSEAKLREHVNEITVEGGLNRLYVEGCKNGAGKFQNGKNRS
jgi:hypothetical protein